MNAIRVVPNQGGGLSLMVGINPDKWYWQELSTDELKKLKKSIEEVLEKK